MMSSSSPIVNLGAQAAVAGSVAAAPLTPRQKQKEATRRRVLDAARELFDSQGYAGTTVREIARRARVSVGSVFTTFPSKFEILSQIMRDRLAELHAELDSVMPHLQCGTVDRLRSMYAIHFAFEVRHKRLFLAYIATAYDWTLPPGALPLGRNFRLQAIIGDCLAKGVAEGDVDPSIELREVIDLLMAAYFWTYRLAAQHDADAPTMMAVMNRQISLIAAGFTARG